MDSLTIVIISIFIIIVSYFIIENIKRIKKNKLWNITYPINPDFKSSNKEKEHNHEVNNRRISNGSKAISADEYATIVARERVEYIAIDGNFSHNDEEGSRVILAEKGADGIGEILGKGFKNKEDLFNAYMESEDHGPILLDKDWDAFGSAIYFHRNIWWYCTIFIRENNI